MEFNGTFPGTTYLIDAPWYLWVTDIGLIGGIIENECIILQGVVHPFAQFRFGNDGSCGIVRIAQIDDIHWTS